MSKKIIFLTIFSLFVNTVRSQDHFKCSEGPFIFRNHQLTNVQGNFDNFFLEFYPEISIHSPVSLGYNTNDNYLYAISDYNDYQLLLKINNTGLAQVIDTLYLDSNYHHWYSGDFPKSTNNLYYIGLDKSTFSEYIIGKINVYGDSPPEVLELTTASENSFRNGGGLVFSPFTNQLFTNGFTNEGFYLATISLETGIIDDETYPINVMPDFFYGFAGIFFDSFGNLFGYALGGNECSGCAVIYHINTTAGVYTYLGEIDGETLAAAGDACNCPYVPALQLSINPTTPYACSNTKFIYKFFYQEPKLQENILLTDTLPEGFIFTEILNNNLGGTVEGLGTNQLKISGINLESELGIDSIEVLVAIPEDALGDYENQAFMTGFNSDFVTESETVYPSDYALTVEKSGDPTPFSVQSFELGNIEDIFHLCPDSTLLLQPLDFAAGFNFNWNTGSTNPQIQVTQSGTYDLTLSNNCESIEVPIQVLDAGILVDIGEDIVAYSGDEIDLEAEVTSLFDLSNSLWSSSESDSLFTCLDCLETIFTPQNDGNLLFEATNEFGCIGKDELSVRLKYDIFFPNAFSPNGDGRNDIFFPYSKNSYLLTNFKIFDRWGALIYSVENVESNSSSVGWDGKFKGKKADLGIYVWTAEISVGSKIIAFKGDVLLVP